jgi:hypothetical protein
VFAFALFVGVYAVVSLPFVLVGIVVGHFGEAWDGVKLDMTSLRSYFRERRHNR